MHFLSFQDRESLNSYDFEIGTINKTGETAVTSYLQQLKTSSLQRSMSISKSFLSAGSKAAQSKLKSLLGDVTEEGKQKLWQMQAEILTKELSQLKGAAMKVGQLVAVYGDQFFPEPFVKKFAELQDDSIRLSWSEIEKCLNRSLGKQKVAELEIEKEAFAAASIGQVHKATIKASGEIICLKIQYPGIAKAIDSDIATLTGIFKMMSLLPVDSSGFQDFLAEAKKMLKREVDYKSEKAMTDFFREAYSHDERIKIPKTYDRYSSSRVLATEFCEGVSIDSEQVKAISQSRRDHLAQAIIDSYFYEVYDLRHIQSDTHFGNFKVRLGEKQDQLVMLDFGACKKYKKNFVEAVLSAQYGVWNRDREQVEEALFELELVNTNDSRDVIEGYIELVFLHFACYSDPESQYYDVEAMNEDGRFLLQNQHVSEG